MLSAAAFSLACESGVIQSNYIAPGARRPFDTCRVLIVRELSKLRPTETRVRGSLPGRYALSHERSLMGDFVRLLIFPAIGVGVSMLYRSTPVLTLAVIRAAMVFSSVLAIGLLFTGLLGSGVHSFASHAFVIVVWILASAGMGMSVGEAIRSHRWWRLAHVVLPMLLLGIGVIASMTGYLSHGTMASGPQQLRFIVIHQIGLPMFLGIVLLSWFLLSRSYAREGA